MKKYITYALIGLLGLLVCGMLTSFLVRITHPPVDSSLEGSVNGITKQERIQVNVLNACGKNGLAANTKEFLRKFKFDVVEIGNYHEKENNSYVIDRLGDRESAEKVAYAMGIPDSCIVTEVDSSLFIRTSIVLGKNYAKLDPFK